MSEQNLHWKNLLGYETESQTIHNLIKNKNLPPVILFHGREGIGKSLFISKVCSYLSCQDSSACGICSSCIRVQNNKSPSLFFIDASCQKLKSPDISNIKDHLLTLGGSNTDSNKRIFYLKDVELLSQQNVNKLLKIFEELPSHCHVFLSTSRRFSLLPTLRSRCVEFLLLPPNLEKSIAFLKHKISTDPHEYEENPSERALQDLLNMSRGSLGLTLQWLKQKDSSPKLAEQFKELLFLQDYKKTHGIIDRLKKNPKSSLEDFIEAQEIALNKALKKLLEQGAAHNTYEILAQKRKDLKELKNIILNQKIKLNKAFVLESLILV